MLNYVFTTLRSSSWEHCRVNNKPNNYTFSCSKEIMVEHIIPINSINSKLSLQCSRKYACINFLQIELPSKHICFELFFFSIITTKMQSVFCPCSPLPSPFFTKPSTVSFPIHLVIFWFEKKHTHIHTHISPDSHLTCFFFDDRLCFEKGGGEGRRGLRFLLSLKFRGKETGVTQAFKRRCL